MIAVFARRDHPEGWGGINGPSRAHGYVVIFVNCDDHDELKAVAKKLDEGFEGIDSANNQYSEGTLDVWFGGQFDLIAVVPPAYVDEVFPIPYYTAGNRFVTKGDNRFVGVYTADEVLYAQD